jgi:D-alanyl-lipoteichoic acid acyltransferase DltB (MBOAT superfamily)
VLFHEQSFLFIFLPISLLGAFIFNRSIPRFAVWWIVICSFAFYSFYGFQHIPLLLISILINYSLGLVIEKNRFTNSNGLLLIIGIIVNLAILAFYKYTDFILSNLAYLGLIRSQKTNLILPLAISFFTFQQIAYLVDLKRGEIRSSRFINYCAFVAFFPQLIAGPIVRYQIIIPQIINEVWQKLSKEFFWTGLCIFSFGLFKKNYLADGLRPLADSIFNTTNEGIRLSLAEAWLGSSAFGLQIYFDFSAYSDMAIGLGLLFGLKIPINFNSPYKARNIIEFWHRWHITLSEFLRDYLYKPLGGNRNGVLAGMTNVFIVMAIGGLWHGAEWTFVIWGCIHGILIAFCHFARSIRNKNGKRLLNQSYNLWMSQLLTFSLVTVTWVFFRSEDFNQAFNITKSMLGLNGLDLPRFLAGSIGLDYFNFNGGLPNQIVDITLIPLFTLCLFSVLRAPNTIQILKIGNKISPNIVLPSPKIIFVSGFLFFFSIKSSFESLSYDFLYFRF